MGQLLPAQLRFQLRSRLKDLYRSMTGQYRLKSFSQEGEDRILARLFHKKDTGFYVDVGAHHPLRFSNTYLFYLRGWHGINIDANPQSMHAFKARRPRDTNLEIGVGRNHQTSTYYRFSDPALNSFDPELSKARNLADSPFRIVGTSEIAIKPLVDILDEYLPEEEKIDFLTVDVEGLDFEVIQSNNWSKYRPTYVLVEALGVDLASLTSSQVVKFMQNQGYSPIAKTVNTVFFGETHNR